MPRLERREEKCVLPRQQKSSRVVAWRSSHCVYDTKYHVVWAPKYRKWILQGEVRERVRELFQEIAGHHGFELAELEVDKNHVHLFLSFPPRYSSAEVVRIFKAVSAKEIRVECPGVQLALWGGEFWEDGYFVRTVGDKVTTEIISQYIRFYDGRTTHPEQLDLF